MVKESMRRRVYRPRGPHKEGCMCVVCKPKRGGGVSQGIPRTETHEKGLVTTHVTYQAPPPPPVRLDSLRNKARFRLGGQEHRAGEKIEGMVVVYNLAINESATLGGSTMVEPI